MVLAGGYIEAGDRGRIAVQAGHVVIHHSFEAHVDHFSPAGAVVLNLPIFAQSDAFTGIVSDPDAIARLAERDIAAASAMMNETFSPVEAQLADWPDRLAAALATAPDFLIEDWAASMGLAPQSISRGFRQAYGVSPKRFRIEQRALRALRKLASWPGTLAALAAEGGFSDQAHLARAIGELTGVAPSRLKVKCVQERLRRAR